jgi:phosphoribosylanthranilate isomerase
MQVKICGLCSAADAALAIERGADLAGVILDAGTSRSQSLEAAAAVLAPVPAARRVGVMVNPTEHAARQAVERLELAVLQLHGEEPVSLGRALRVGLGVRIWKCVRPHSAADITAVMNEWTGVADGFLLDGWSPLAAGGTGTAFDWSLGKGLREALPGTVQLIAAGGLTAHNVASLIAAVDPDVVDVSSGVEAATCRKDPARLEEFIIAARAAGRRRRESES